MNTSIGKTLKSMGNFLRSPKAETRGNRGPKTDQYFISTVHKMIINVYISLVFKQELVFVYETKKN